MTAHLVVTGPGFIAPDGTAQTWHFEGTGFDTLGSLTDVVFSAVALYGTLTLHFPLPGQDETDTGDTGVLTFSGATGTLVHFEVDVTTSGSGGSWWWSSGQVGEFVNFNWFTYTFVSDPGIGDTDLIVVTPDSDTYGVDVTGVYVDVPAAIAPATKTIQLDSTHMLVWGSTGAGATFTAHMAVCDFSDPLNPAFGSVTDVVSPAEAYSTGCVVGDGSAVMFASKRDPASVGAPAPAHLANWYYTLVDWDGDVTLTEGATSSERIDELWVDAMVAVSSTRLLAIGHTFTSARRMYLFDADETGITSVLDTDTSSTSTTTIYGVVSSTKVLIGTNVGGLRLVDLTSDAITFPADRDTGSDTVGVEGASGIIISFRQETTDPTKFRGYTADTTWAYAFEYQVSSTPTIDLLNIFQFQAAEIFLISAGVEPDTDGLTSRGVDDNDLSVYALGRLTSDFRHRNISARYTTTTAVDSRSRLWNVGDGLVMTVAHRITGGGSTRVELWEIVTIPTTPPFFAPVTAMWDVQIITGR